jgi:hypothetical protein
VVRESGGAGKGPSGRRPCGWMLMFRYRLQRPVLGALPTEWDPLRGLPWRGHRYCASRGGGSSFAKAPCGLRPPAKRAPSGRRANPLLGGSAEIPLRPAGPAPVAATAGVARGGRSPPSSACYFPTLWVAGIFHPHALAGPAPLVCAGELPPCLSIWAVFAGWGGDSLPPGPHPTAAQGRRWVHRRAAG